MNCSLCNDSFYLFLREIEWNLDNGNHISALFSSLTIPDICGKIFYPKCATNKFRYVSWYDTYVGRYNVRQSNVNIVSLFLLYLSDISFYYNILRDVDDKSRRGKESNFKFWYKRYGISKAHFCLTGELIYELRNNLIHSGYLGTTKVDGILFLFTTSTDARYDIVRYGDTDILYCLNVDKLCRQLIRVAFGMWKENSSLFSEFKFDVYPYNSIQYQIEASRLYDPITDISYLVTTYQ